MAFNLSSVDIGLYFVCNTAVNTLLFSLMILPPFVLCLVCILALFFARDINSKIWLLLVNIFTAEICNWISYTIITVGWPIRFHYKELISCKVFTSSFILSGIQRFIAGAIYAVNVYIFIKYGDKKLKWYMIVPFVIITWLVTVAISTLPYFLDSQVKNVHGFCSFDPGSRLFVIAALGILTVAVTLLVVQLIFGLLTVVFIKRNVLVENTDVKKAIAKVLAYLLIASILSFINNVVPLIGPVLRRLTADDDIIGIIATNYVIRSIFNVPAIATPIVAILLLKPVRLALKTIPRRLCPNNRIYPVNN